MQQVLENGEEREARLARRKPSITNVLRDSGPAQCTAERLTCENPNRRGLCDSIKYLSLSNNWRRASETLYQASSIKLYSRKELTI